MIGELHRIVGRQAHNRNGIVTAQSVTGEQRSFTKAHFKLFDVCASRQLKAAIGEKLLSRSGSKKGQVINGERLTVAGWDERGNPISSDGRTISHRNLCHAYASTVRKVQGSSATKVIVGFDRLSVKSATQDAAYVASSRGREFCQVHVESIADLSQIQNRSGDRKAATEMPVEKLTTQLQAIVDQTEKARRSKLLTVPQTFKSTPAAQRCTNCNPGNTLAAVDAGMER